jgi:hypothetical protein
VALTGHRSVQTAMRYFQAGSVHEIHAANLLAAFAWENPPEHK